MLSQLSLTAWAYTVAVNNLPASSCSVKCVATFLTDEINSANRKWQEVDVTIWGITARDTLMSPFLKIQSCRANN